MNPLTLGDKVVVADSKESVKNPLSIKEITEKLTSIDALQIELIGLEIANNVLNNLGPIGTARVMQKVMQKKGASMSGPMAIIMRMNIKSAQEDIKEGKSQFLSELKAAEFLSLALHPIKDAITERLSTPDSFIQSGTLFKLSDYDPAGFLKETADKMGLDITMNDVPNKYYVFLTLDKEATQEKSELVFALTERSQDVEFSNRKFTISELEQNFRSSIT